tara:strand:- start:201 stop:479 length:279 start_codon:yes stop_codon:yes gene_type:complete
MQTFEVGVAALVILALATAWDKRVNRDMNVFGRKFQEGCRNVLSKAWEFRGTQDGEIILSMVTSLLSDAELENLTGVDMVAIRNGIYVIQGE